MPELKVVDRIKMIIDQRSINMSELAAKCDWPPSKMSKILSGDQKISVDDLVAIASALGINPALLISLNMSDVESSNKEIMPLSRIFRRAAHFRNDVDTFASLLDDELTYTVSQYLGLKDSGKTVYSLVKYRRLKADGTMIVPNPRVLITDRREGQLFANQLTIGYWFTEDGKYVYLAIHYMKRAATREKASPVARDDMREYFRVLAPVGRGYDLEERMDLGKSSPESRTYGAGTIFCKRYLLDSPYREEKLKEDLKNIYDAYLKLLDDATKRVQETYENMYKSRREIERKSRPGQDDTVFDKTDLDRIMPVESATMSRTGRAIRAKSMALIREEYKCELGKNHTTFVDRATGENYMEGHFLLPLSSQPDFKNSLEVEANVCCLCPNCNARLRYAADVERQELLMQLYLKHKDMLKEAGIEITPMQLFKFYGMS